MITEARLCYYEDDMMIISFAKDNLSLKLV